MKSIKGTKTESNIRAAFMGESQARNRYTFFEEQAKKEGHEDVAALFERMARNESMHAKIWYKLLNDGIDDTITNIQMAAKGENGEWRSMYPNFAAVAREEGLDDIADMFTRVAAIEQDHEKSFLQAMIEMYKKEPNTEEKQTEEPLTVTRKVPGYRCMFCGAVFEGQKDVCPVCEAIGSFQYAMIEKTEEV